MPFVLDASVIIAILLIDNPSERDSTSIQERLSEESAVVPAVFMPEVLQVLVKGERRIRGVSDVLNTQLAILRSLPIAVDPQTAVHLDTHTLALARTHRLSIYDAAYLELAMRESLPLATFDKALIRAAGAMQVPLVA